MTDRSAVERCTIRGSVITFRAGLLQRRMISFLHAAILSAIGPSVDGSHEDVQR